MPTPEEWYRDFLESSVKEFRIFIDTGSLLDIHADVFWAHIVPVLERERKTVVVPLRVYEEVKKLADNPLFCAQKSGDPSLNQRARSALRNIDMLWQRNKLVEVFGEKGDNSADNVFQTVFTQYRMKYSLMLITQNLNLASDILNIEKTKSTFARHRISVCRINGSGYLSPFSVKEKASGADRHSSSSQSSAGQARVPDDERFAFTTTLRNVSGSLRLSHVPCEGEDVIAERNGKRSTLRLTKEGPAGGEGTVFSTSVQGLVAKIYKPEKIDKAKFEKLSLMMTKQIECEGVCFPLTLIYNQKNEFAGYLMREAKGETLQNSVFTPRRKKIFPNWNKVDTVTLCVTILKKIKYLHDRNVILGDINPSNILVVSPTEVYFVDTDSYQVEGFPCPVGMNNYTAPEIQRKDFHTFLRTRGNENFAVATLLFMIMLPGKTPYALQGGEDMIENIINGDFAYAFGEKSTKKAPEGPWRFCWSHLPYFLKEDFYKTFRKGEKHYSEQARYGAGHWLYQFERYLGLLTSGKVAEQDPMSLDLFPTRFKRSPKVKYVQCRICGKEVEEEKTRQGICWDCLNAVYTTVRCSACGKDFEITYGEKEFYEQKGLQLPKKCKDCRGRKTYASSVKYVQCRICGKEVEEKKTRQGICRDCLNAVYTTVRCSVCGKDFEITYGEKQFYEQKGWQLPKKCKDCRGRKTYASSSNAEAVDEDDSDLCFITTAACEYFDKPDNCYELITLRRFRDGWLAAQPGGDLLIREYYRIAPSIVSELEVSEYRDVIYGRIWDRYIVPCVRLIEQNAYEACRALYEKMVLELKQNILKEETKHV